MYTALYSSVAGNLIADLVVIFTFVPMGMASLAFGPRELFALMCLAMTTLLLFAEGGIYKAVIGAMIGFFLASIGTDPIVNLPRLSFGIRQLESGIPLVPFAVGLFALTEMLVQYRSCFARKVEALGSDFADIAKLIRHRLPEDKLSVREWLTYWREVLIGSGIGVFLGALPGPGGTMSAFTSYAVSSRLAKNKGKFGTGVPEGVAAAESGNSATVGPTLIPLFAFGIPGSGTAGIFMGAFMMQGITPGPALFTDHVDVMLAVFMLMLVGTFFNLIISKLALIPIFARMGLVHPRILVPVLVPMMVLGMYAMSIRPFDVVVMVGAGILGLGMRHWKIPFAPTLVAFMIGPLFEKQFKRALILSGGDPTYWFSSPIALALYATAIVVAAILLLRRNRQPRVSA
jgi:putative tricarboxylic transport membrane protein